MSTSADKNSLVFYRRILWLDELFSAEIYPSLKRLVNDEEVGASRTTIFRTIEFMRDQLHAPIVFDREKGGYCYSEKTFSESVEELRPRQLEWGDFQRWLAKGRSRDKEMKVVSRIITIK